MISEFVLFADKLGCDPRYVETEFMYQEGANGKQPFIFGPDRNRALVVGVDDAIRICKQHNKAFPDFICQIESLKTSECYGDPIWPVEGQ